MREGESPQNVPRVRVYIHILVHLGGGVMAASNTITSSSVEKNK